MIRIIILVCFLSFTQNYLYAQAQLHGYVTEQNSGKKPVEHVLIKSLFANEIMSNSNGEFLLVYQNIVPGTNVMVTAIKDNWVVINEKEMNLNLPENSKENKLKIVMCPATVLEARKKEYYQINDKYITLAYEKKLKAIDRQKAGWEIQVSALQEELQRLQKQLVDIADEYSKTNLDDLTEKEKQAYQLYKEGKIDESRKLRESFESEKNYRKALKERKIIEKDKNKLDSIDKQKIEEISFHKRNLKQLATDAQLRFDFAEAERILEFLVTLDTTDFDSRLEFAIYLSNQNQNEKALGLFKKLLLLSKDENNISIIQNNIGVIYTDQNNFTKAKESLKASLEIRNKIALDESNFYYKYLIARSLTNLGILYKNEGDFPEAEKHLKEAVKIFKHVDIDKSSNYHAVIVQPLFALGVLYMDRNNYPEAETILLEALKILENLGNFNFDQYDFYLAVLKFNLGKLYSDKRNFSEAEKNSLEAINAFEKLADKNPSRFDEYLAKGSAGLGYLYLYMGEYIKSESAFFKAINSLNRLSEKDPDKYQPSIALSKYYLAQLYSDRSNFSSSEKFYKEALLIYNRLYENDTVAYSPYIANTLSGLGSLYYKIKNFPEAEKYFRIALQHYRPLCLKYPDSYDDGLAFTLYNLGVVLYVYKNEIEESVKLKIEAIQIYERLAALNPVTFDFNLSLAILTLGDRYKENNMYDKLVALSLKFPKLKEILGRNPTLPWVKTHYSWLESLEEFIKNYDSYKQISILKNKINNEIEYSKKISLQNKVIKEIKKLIEKGLINAITDLGSAYGRLSWFFIFNNQYADAEQAAKAAISSPYKNKPEDYDGNMEWVNTNLALSLLFQGKYADAEKIYLAFKDKSYNNSTYKNAFLADLDELEKAGITHPDVAKVRALLNK